MWAASEDGPRLEFLDLFRQLARRWRPRPNETRATFWDQRRQVLTGSRGWRTTNKDEINERSGGPQRLKSHFPLLFGLL